MPDSIGYDILAYEDGAFVQKSVPAIRETLLTIRVHGEEVVSLLCTGKDPRCLAAGFLYTSGVIGAREDIARLDVEEREEGIEVRVELKAGTAREAQDLGSVVTSGLGRARRQGLPGQGRVTPPAEPFLAPDTILALARELEARSGLYRLTRGCHNASLCSGDRMLLFREDIGRHNAIDMIAGHCLLEGTGTAERMILSTGRIASEIVHKAIRIGVPVLASTAVATGLAVDTARRAGLALIGNIGAAGFWVYNDNGSLSRT